MVMAGSAEPRQPSTRRPNFWTSRSVKGACDSRASRSRCLPLVTSISMPVMQFDRTAPVAPDHAVRRGDVENLDHDGRGRAEHQRPGEQRMRAERYHEECFDARPDHRTTGGEGVRGRAGGSRNQHSVAGPARQRPAIDLDQALRASAPARPSRSTPR